MTNLYKMILHVGAKRTYLFNANFVHALMSHLSSLRITCSGREVVFEIIKRLKSGCAVRPFGLGYDLFG